LPLSAIIRHYIHRKRGQQRGHAAVAGEIMARGINRLSPSRVRSTKRKGMYPDGLGLYLRVTEGAHGPTKSWLFRYGIGGRERYCGLGPLHTIGLAEAREKAKECRQIILDGGDPIAARKARRSEQWLASAKAMTFEECAKAYIHDHAPTWRSVKSGEQWQSSLKTYVYPIIGKLLVRDISTAEVLRVLEPIWKTIPETASRIRGRVQAILAWAAVRGYRSSENPARWADHLKEALPSRKRLAPVKRLPGLSYTDVGKFFAELNDDPAIAARALQFAILCAVRTNEVRLAQWDEFDLNTQIWTIPAARTKANRDHRVPLSGRAVEILTWMQQLRNRTPFVFLGRSLQQPLGEGALREVVVRLGRKGLATPHGFRSTFRTWLAEKTNFQGEVGEAALGHVKGDRVEAAYQRGDLFEKRRKLMTAWAKLCTGTKGKVLPIRVVS
jgi:integrase